MKKKVLLLVFLVSSVMQIVFAKYIVGNSSAKQIVTNDVIVDMGDNPGTLASRLGNDIYNITSLSINGQINGEDLATLRSMMGLGFEEFNSDNYNLSKLNLQNARIVKGGEYKKNYTLRDNDILPSSVFEYTKSLTEFTTPTSLKVIGEHSLAFSEKPLQVNLNDGLETIDWGAFAWNDFQTLNIPASVKKISYGFIYGCKNLSDITIDAANEYYVCSDNAIYTKDGKTLTAFLSSFTGDFVIPDQCAIIEGTVQAQMKSLVGKNIKTIGDISYFPEILAFGDSLNSIGSLRHSGRSLDGETKAYYFGCRNVPQGNYQNNNSYRAIEKAIVYVPEESVSAFKDHKYWSHAKDIKPIEYTDFAYLTGKEGPLNNLVFVDNEGGVVADGIHWTINEVVDQGNNKIEIPFVGLNVKNLQQSSVEAKLIVTVKSISNGQFSICFGDQCHTLSSSGTIEINDIIFSGGQTLSINDISWAPIYGQYGTSCIVDFQLCADGNTGGPLVSVQFNYPETFLRRMVVEEGTGTWCGFCVRGIATIDYMNSTYPDNFLAVALHCDDEMDNDNNYLNFSSWPIAYYNRKYLNDISKEIAEEYLLNQSGLQTDKMVRIENISYSDTEKTFLIHTSTRFGWDISDADYRLVYIVTEDKVGPYVQSNYYSGTGEEMGGFQGLPSYTFVEFDDVFREVYPSKTGVPGSIPATLKLGTSYDYEYEIAIPDNVDNTDNMQLTVLLYDYKTGEILNADRKKLSLQPEDNGESEDNGNTSQALIVHLTSGQQVEFLLDEQPVITFSDTQMLITTQMNVVAFPASDVRKFTYNIPASDDVDSDEMNRGDVNGDKRITVTDLIELITYVNTQLKPAGFNEKNADVDGDGMPTQTDIDPLANMILNQ